MKTTHTTVAALAAGLAASQAGAAILYSNTLTAGPAPGWQTTNGAWSWTGSGLHTGQPAENRIFLAGAAGAAGDFHATFDASLNAGAGWSFFFGATLTSGNLATGHTFNYEPGFGTGAFLLKSWQTDEQMQLAATFVSLPEGVFQTIEVSRTGSLFEARLGGQTVMSFTLAEAPAGPLFGFRTWYSGDATFRNLTIQGTPIPAPAGSLALVLGVAIAGRRRRS